jgi:hypothetical protein
MATIPNKQTETTALPAPPANTKQTDVLISLLSQANQLTLPEGFETSSSWKRAQQSTDIIGSRNAGQWQISLPRLDGTLGGDYCVTFCLQSDEYKHEQANESRILADCSCKAYEFRDICCHVLYFWWRFCQHNLFVYDIETREYHQSPPQSLTLRESQPDPDPDPDQEQEQNQEIAA